MTARFPCPAVVHVTSARGTFAKGASQFLSDLIQERLATREAENEKIIVALSGGTTPDPVYCLLGSKLSCLTKISDVRFVQTDERNVHSNHPDCNARMIRRALFSHGGLEERLFLPVKVFPENPEKTVLHFLQEFVARFPTREKDTPTLDLALLGLGEDGHTASLFPGSDWNQGFDDKAFFRAFHLPHPAGTRYSLTWKALLAAKKIVFLVTGKRKAPMVGKVLSGEVPDLPAGALALERETFWLLDPEASGGI